MTTAILLIIGKMSERVVFLDCDGVLATKRCMLYADPCPELLHDAEGIEDTPLERRCLSELKRVVDETGAKVVLSTTWRLDPEQRRFLVHALEEFGIVVIGDTPDSHEGRGYQIAAWLREHPEVGFTLCRQRLTACVLR